MQAMFDQPVGRLERRRKFERRMWQSEESFGDYCHHKIILGNRVPIDEKEMVDYLIDGIPSESLKNQARMHSFSTVQQVIKAFRAISLKSVQGVHRREIVPSREVRGRPGGGRYEIINEETTKRSPKMSTRGVTRCYECNGNGHYARECPSRTKSVTRAARSAKVKRQIGLVESEKQESERSSSEDDGEKESREEEENVCVVVDIEQEVKDVYKKVVQISFNNSMPLSCVARIDTGSPISLVQKNM